MNAAESLATLAIIALAVTLVRRQRSATAPTRWDRFLCWFSHRKEMSSDGLYVFTKCIEPGCRRLVRMRELREIREERRLLAGYLRQAKKRREAAKKSATLVLLRGGR